jgi:hypothetical protein
MSQNAKRMFLRILIIGFITLLAGMAAAGQEVSITGTINAESQLVADSGMTYDIDDNEMGNEVMELVGKKVSVKGTVVDAEETKIITITAFDVSEP